MAAPGWRGFVPERTSDESRTWVAEYRVCGVAATTWSSLDWNEAISPARRLQALTKRPEWCPFPWPTPSPPGDATDQATTELALLKLTAFFCFGADVLQLHHQEDDEHGVVVAQVNSALTVVLHSLLPGPRGLLAARATIWDNGSCDGGTDEPTDADIARAQNELKGGGDIARILCAAGAVSDRHVKQLALRDLARCLAADCPRPGDAER